MAGQGKMIKEARSQQREPHAPHSPTSRRLAAAAAGTTTRLSCYSNHSSLETTKGRARLANTSHSSLRAILAICLWMHQVIPLADLRQESCVHLEEPVSDCVRAVAWPGPEGLDGQASSLPNLSGGAYAVGPRRRTRRIMIHHLHEQYAVFVPQQWGGRELEAKVAFHFGYHPVWVECQWEGASIVHVQPKPWPPL